MKLDNKGLLIPHLYRSFICMYIVRRLPSRQIFVFGYCRELLISTVSKSRRGETFHLLLIIKNQLTDYFGTKRTSESNVLENSHSDLQNTKMKTIYAFKCDSDKCESSLPYPNPPTHYAQPETDSS